MPIDFSKISKLKDSKRIIEPIELFQSVRVTDPAINDMWLAQGDALQTWHDNRAEADIAIVLNTGAGKTLVGLLAAQSLVNETRGHIAYACSSIQLVEQTAAKAVGYRIGTKLLKILVARDGIEPPTPAFSGPLTESPKWFEIDGYHLR